MIEQYFVNGWIAALDAEREERSANRAETRAGKRAERVHEDEPPLLRSVQDTSSLSNLDVLNAANRSRAEQKRMAMDALLNVYQDDPRMSYADAGRQVGRSKSWVASALGELEVAGRIHRNGGGVEVNHG